SFMFLLLVGLLFRLRCIFSSASEGFAGQHDFGSLWRRNSRGRSAEPTNAYNPNGKNLRTEMDWLPPMIQSDQWLFPKWRRNFGAGRRCKFERRCRNRIAELIRIRGYNAIAVRQQHIGAFHAELIVDL